MTSFWVIFTIVSILSLMVLTTYKVVKKIRNAQAPTMPALNEEKSIPGNKYGLRFNVIETVAQFLPEKPEYTNWTLEVQPFGLINEPGQYEALQIAQPNDAILKVALTGSSFDKYTYVNLTRYKKPKKLVKFDELKEINKYAQDMLEYYSDRWSHGYRSSRWDDDEPDKEYAFEKSWQETQEKMKRVLNERNELIKAEPVEIEDFLTRYETFDETKDPTRTSVFTDPVKKIIMTQVVDWSNEVVKDYRLNYANVDYEVKVI